MPGRRRSPGPSGPRLFVALDPPDDVRGALAAWGRAQRRAVPGLRLVPPEHLHVTLAFLGPRDPGEVAPIAGAVVGAAETHGALGLALGAPLWLPPRRPRVLAVELHDERGDLRALQAVADALGAAVGWSADRGFRPHVTVARLRPDAAPRDRALDPTPQVAFDGAAVTLYRSFLEPAGARYVPVERVALG
ncbi:RNA 2',3'-cyclic phosphodiesterase [Patulibacter sp. SYSU D01012]|uniref:RNA 2',3'-cyclic phosphodiesterase n=1 Tax=Patulibacter sp. SYSU D01012 TaxID=2817381 RepID=UPI001B308846|nr:RNA 2',3'-cyclic phosphodiesterase [Patulibacter sp. SYSU D01012]